jgi:hypothetical protein
MELEEDYSVTTLLPLGKKPTVFKLLLLYDLTLSDKQCAYLFGDKIFAGRLGKCFFLTHHILLQDIPWLNDGLLTLH